VLHAKSSQSGLRFFCKKGDAAVLMVNLSP